jgi:hypothetical protein
MSKLDQRILEKLNELIQFGERVKQTNYSRSTGNMVYMDDRGVNDEMAQQWGTSCLNLLIRVFGPDSVHYKHFETLFPSFHDYSPITQALGGLRSAKNDYEQGLLFDTRTLIEAEVLDNFLEQGEHLLDSGYYQPAAVVVGSDLEDGLRRLCAKHEVPLSVKPKVDSERPTGGLSRTRITRVAF